MLVGCLYVPLVIEGGGPQETVNKDIHNYYYIAVLFDCPHFDKLELTHSMFCHSDKL